MDYYEITNALTGKPRNVIIHNEVLGLEDAVVKSGGSVDQVGQVEYDLRILQKMIVTLLSKGYKVRLPFGTFKGRLSSDMKYSVSFSIDKNLLSLVAGSATFTKKERPASFLSLVTTSFGMNTTMTATEQAVVVRGMPFSVRGKFPSGSTFFLVNSDEDETDLTVATRSSTLFSLRLDTPFSSTDGKMFLRNDSGNELAVPYSVLYPIFLDTQLQDIGVMIPYVGDIGGLGEADFYGSFTNFIGVVISIASSRSSFTVKLVKRLGLNQADASSVVTVYLTTFMAASDIFFEVLLGTTRVLIHRANFLQYLNDFHRYTGFTKFFKLGG